MVARAESLRHNSVFYIALGFRICGGAVPAPHWIYVPEPQFLMYRVGVLSNYSPEVAPTGSILLCVEIAFPGDAARRVDPAALRERVLADLASIGLLDASWILDMEYYGVIDCAYAIFDRQRAEAVPAVLGYLERKGIYSIGRYGAWQYGSMGDALTEGRDCADLLHGVFRSGR